MMSTKIYDENLVVLASTVISATGNQTALAVSGLGVGDFTYKAVIDVTAVVGIFDGANNFTLQVQSSTDGITFTNVGEVITALAIGESYIAINSTQVVNATHFRIAVTMVGTTATSVTATAFLTKV